jgi:hypothetical protein
MLGPKADGSLAIGDPVGGSVPSRPTKLAHLNSITAIS